MARSSRRGHHEGCVYYEPERERWVAEITIDTGQRKKYRAKTKQEAIRKKNEVLRELEQGVLATGPQRKLGAYLEDWLENVHKSTLKVSAYVKYQKNIKYILTDRIGNIWLQKLMPEQVQRFYVRLSDKGLSSKTVNAVHGVLHLALDNAVRWGYVARNVCDVVSPPRIVTKEAVFLTVEQAHILLDAVREHRLEVLFLLMMVTGMRRGEVLALRWSDIDFDRYCLHVLHTVDYIPKYGYIEDTPKSKAGKRKINLPFFLIEILEEQKQEVDVLKTKAGEEWTEMDLVFPSLKGGYFNPGYLWKVFKKILHRAGLADMRLHDLRHSTVTILLAKGVHIKVISELLGHSDIVITLRTYGHLLPSMQSDVVAAWEEEFRKPGIGDLLIPHK
jgi:integrase